MILLGIGELGASGKPDEVIRTLALGSCVAVVLWSARAGAGGMVHVALPSSSLNPTQARRRPGRFADTGIAALLDEMDRLGCGPGPSDLVARIAGGAAVLDLGDHLDIGARNVEAVRAVLAERRLPLVGEDVRGQISRSVELEVGTGAVRVIAANRTSWEI